MSEAKNVELIKIGDNVILKNHNSFPMTVGGIKRDIPDVEDWDKKYDLVDCVWHDINGKPRERSYRSDALTKLSPEE